MSASVARVHSLSNELQPVTQSLPLYNSDVHLYGSSASLEEHGLLRTGNPVGDGDVAESRDNRCVLDRLGCHPGGQNVERFVAEQTMFSTHKLFRALDHMEISELFSASPARTPCARALRQYHSGEVYQSPGRYALVETSRSSSQAVTVEQLVFPVVTRNSCPRHSEQRSDLLSRGNPLYGDWCLHPQIVGLIWMRFGQATVDLFALHENSNCPMFFSLKDVDAPLWVDALAHP